MRLSFEERAWKNYLYWFESDPKLCQRIHQLIKNTQRTPFEGIGKPEALRGNYRSFWSRRINSEHRMIYTVMQRETASELVILSLKGHYTR